MILDPTASAIIAGLVVTIISGTVIAFLKRRWEVQDVKTQAKKEEIDKFEKRIANLEEVAIKMQKSSWRQNKTLLIIAKILDDQTNKLHSDLTSNLQDIASELLKESDKG